MRHDVSNATHHRLQRTLLAVMRSAALVLPHPPFVAASAPVGRGNWINKMRNIFDTEPAGDDRAGDVGVLFRHCVAMRSRQRG